MTLVKSFRATTYIKAFALNSLLLAITTTVAYVLYRNLDNIDNIPEWTNGIITLILTFIVSLTVYIIFFYLFSFGGGMIASPHDSKYNLFSN
jgi:uncharacterized protein involved in cysteine biosynthesis